LEQRLIQENMAKYFPERKNIWSKDLFRKIKFQILRLVLLFLKCYAFREKLSERERIVTLYDTSQRSSVLFLFVQFHVLGTGTSIPMKFI
jgi:hypothetical protein